MNSAILMFSLNVPDRFGLDTGRVERRKRGYQRDCPDLGRCYEDRASRRDVRETLEIVRDIPAMRDWPRTRRRSTMRIVHYRLLGPLEVSSGETMLDLGAPKQRAVLAVLLVNRGAVVSVDAIVDAVWGDDPPSSVAAGLQAYVSNLRRILRDESTAASPIVRRAPGYVLDVEAAAVDRDVFLRHVVTAREAAAAGSWQKAAEAARGGLTIWRGAPLSEFLDDDWARAERDRLEPLRQECREHLVAALLALGQPAAALAEADEGYRSEPLRERAVWLLMLCLYRVGRSVDALELFRAHSADLDEQLGLEPAAALRDLHTAILRQERSLDRWPDVAAEAGPARDLGGPAAADASAPTPPADPTDFVGREGELSAIDAVLESLGSTRWLVLTGPAGIGKTRLAEEAVHAAWHGRPVVRTTCPEDAGTPPWWPVRAIVRALGSDPDAVLTPPHGVDADAARFAVYERLDRLLHDSSTTCNGPTAAPSAGSPTSHRRCTTSRSPSSAPCAAASTGPSSTNCSPRWPATRAPGSCRCRPSPWARWPRSPAG
jgi:DNA-binding SARP family transcriptional activator